MTKAAKRPAAPARGWALLVIGTLLFTAGSASAMANVADKDPASRPGSVRIVLLSNRADLVSGGDALAAVLLPTRANPAAVRITVGGRDVSKNFNASRWRAMKPILSSSYSGLDPRMNAVAGKLTGLNLGRNVVEATLPDGSGARLMIANHPIGGPVFSGPQIQPWPCPPVALDKQCNQPTKYEYQYVSSVTGQFAAYDRANPQTDVATTTTQNGKTVPFIVRIETGWADRDRYQIAVLFDPKQPWSPWKPQSTWGGKALVTQGGSCGNHRGATGTGTSGAALGDNPPSVMRKDALSIGYAVMTTALANSAHNCNVVLQSEAVMMLKEHFVDSYGPLRFAIAQGVSGGSLSSLQDQNAYPGLYQGVLPAQTFPDTWTSAMDAVDCPLLDGYFSNPAAWGLGVAWTENMEMAAAGKSSPTVCRAWTHVFPFYQSINPAKPPVTKNNAAIDLQNCGLPDDQRWSSTNHKGVRCALQDSAVNVFGRRPADGYANRPLSNVGVMYGLQALRAGTIDSAQFVDLNAKIGSHDIDLVWQPGRVAADAAAVRAAYRSGMVNEATNLGDVPIIDLPALNADIHEEYRAFALRSRLDRAFGNHNNDVIWYGTTGNGLVSGPPFTDAFAAMDEWVTAISKDRSRTSLRNKVVRNKPAYVRDMCQVAGQTDLGGQSTCQQLGSPGAGTRGGAGSPIATDILDCQLKPLRQSDYYPALFTDTQWAQLHKTFPKGVCDYSKPGVGQRPTVAWQTYMRGPGGRPLGAPPQSIAIVSRGTGARLR